MAKAKLVSVVQVRLTRRVMSRVERLAEEMETTRAEMIRRLIVEATRANENLLAIQTSIARAG